MSSRGLWKLHHAAQTAQAKRDFAALVTSGNNKNPQMDWQQVVLNGGPPCFAQLDDEDGYYCGRAKRWEGHDGEHKFVSLDDLITTIRQEERRAAFRDAIEITDRLVCDPNYDGNWRNGYGQAQSDMEDALEAAANETREDGDDG